jgi:hypothetical protein
LGWRRRSWLKVARMIERHIKHGGQGDRRLVVHVGGVRLCLWTAANNSPLVHSPGDIWTWGAMVEWYWQGKTEELEEKAIPVPLCPPQIPYGLTRARARASTMRSRRQTETEGSVVSGCFAFFCIALFTPFTKNTQATISSKSCKKFSRSTLHIARCLLRTVVCYVRMTKRDHEGRGT